MGCTWSKKNPKKKSSERVKRMSRSFLEIAQRAENMLADEMKLEEEKKKLNRRVGTSRKKVNNNKKCKFS